MIDKEFEIQITKNKRDMVIREVSDKAHIKIKDIPTNISQDDLLECVKVFLDTYNDYNYPTDANTDKTKKLAAWCYDCNRIIDVIEVPFNYNNSAENYDEFEKIIESKDIKCDVCDDKVIYLDADIADIIIAFTSKGYRTLFSCSGHEYSESSYVLFEDDPKITKNILSNLTSDDMMYFTIESRNVFHGICLMIYPDHIYLNNHNYFKNEPNREPSDEEERSAYREMLNMYLDFANRLPQIE